MPGHRELGTERPAVLEGRGTGVLVDDPHPLKIAPALGASYPAWPYPTRVGSLNPRHVRRLDLLRSWSHDTSVAAVPAGAS